MNLGSNINFFIGLQSQIKINHWQTKSYARHGAFGSFYDAMDDLIDDFVESAMGKNGRFDLDEETSKIELVNLSELDIPSFINTIREAILQISEQLEETDSDLKNLIDEMISKINKLSYLLTLK